MRAAVRTTILLLAILLATGGRSPSVLAGEPGTIAGRDPLPEVTVARSGEEARELLSKELPEAGGRLFLVSPHDYLSSLILPLAREGTLAEVTALLPFDNVLGPEHLEQIRTFEEKAGVPEAERNSLALANGSIAGTVGGVPFVLRTLASLPAQEGKRVLLVVDTAFLPAVYRNEVKTPMVELAWKLVRTLADRRIEAARAVLFDATGREDFPLEQGFLRILLREMLADPSRFAGALPERWMLLRAAESSYFFAQYPEAMNLYRSFLEQVPEDASSRYKIALMAARDLDPEMSLQWLNGAADADPLYRRGFSEVAGLFFRKELFEGAERVLLAGLARFPKDPLLATNLSALYLSRGDAFREAGDAAGAAGFYREAAAAEGADPQIRERAKAMGESLSGVLPK